MLRTDLEQFLGTFAESIVAVRWSAAQAPRFGEWPGALDPRVVAAAQSMGIDRPWSHQAAALEGLLGGQNVVLASGTASGKSLPYMALALHRFLAEPEATVLYVAPTKALAHDQRARWLRLLTPLLDDAPRAVATYDGDTPSAARSAVRRL